MSIIESLFRIKASRSDDLMYVLTTDKVFLNRYVSSPHTHTLRTHHIILVVNVVTLGSVTASNF